MMRSAVPSKIHSATTVAMTGEARNVVLEMAAVSRSTISSGESRNPTRRAGTSFFDVPNR